MWAYKQPRYLQAAGGQGARCAPREKFGEKFGERLENRRSLVGVAGFEPATPSTRCATRRPSHYDFAHPMRIDDSAGPVTIGGQLRFEWRAGLRAAPRPPDILRT